MISERLMLLSILGKSGVHLTKEAASVPSCDAWAAAKPVNPSLYNPI